MASTALYLTSSPFSPWRTSPKTLAISDAFRHSYVPLTREPGDDNDNTMPGQPSVLNQWPLSRERGCRIYVDTTSGYVHCTWAMNNSGYVCARQRPAQDRIARRAAINSKERPNPRVWACVVYLKLTCASTVGPFALIPCMHLISSLCTPHAPPATLRLQSPLLFKSRYRAVCRRTRPREGGLTVPPGPEMGGRQQNKGQERRRDGASLPGIAQISFTSTGVLPAQVLVHAMLDRLFLLLVTKLTFLHFTPKNVSGENRTRSTSAR
ncbi:hypothetical protein C8J57DRAFT_1320249 [Mycena rebaudengoi]|nr:hypothetical protein C8J57DRAFT_1320249 [Mycena rebaudengoi]